MQPKARACELMSTCAVARNQRGALTQAGAGIAVSRLQVGRFRAAFVSSRRGESTCERTIMSRTVSSRVRLVGARVLAGRLRDCGSPIADIKYNPGRYQNQNRHRRRRVTSSWGVPLVPFKFYKVDDGTGEMTVVAHNGRTPSKGSRVRVKGACQRFGDVRRPVARPAPRTEGYRFQAAVTPPGPLLRDANDDSGHVVVRRRFAAPLRHGVEDRLDDRLRRRSRDAVDHLDQPRGA